MHVGTSAFPSFLQALLRLTRGAVVREGVRAGLALIFGVLLWLPTSNPTAAGDARDAVSLPEDYKLGAQDKVRVMVFEWRPSRDEIFAWSALNAEYTVGASGKLALPLIGEVHASGKTTRDLSQAIGEALRDRMGLGSAPDTAVEVTKFRPFYITGNVDKPGEYPYRPGLTALQGVSIAGGMVRVADASLMRLRRDSLVTQGELELLDKDRDALLARKARLEAEFKRLNEVNFPPSLLIAPATSAAGKLVEQERVVFVSRKSAFDTQMKTMQELKGYLEKEVQSTEGQLKAHRRQVELMRTELAGVTTLAAKGLATAPRKLALERNLAQLEGDGLRLESNGVRVRQDISRNDIAMVELETKRSSDVAADLQATLLQLDQTGRKAETANKLLYESEVVTPQLTMQRAKITPQYKIVRMVGASSFTEMDAEENTILQPGDTVKVELPLPQDLRQAVSPAETSGTHIIIESVDNAAPRRAALDGSKHVPE